jgi:arylsulfatase A-like enzyme
MPDMKITRLLTVLVVLFATQLFAAEHPNVVLIMTDDQGYGDLGCHGNLVVKTPNIDALHRESVRLTNFHVDPTCSPTRAALLTGRYSPRTGVWHTIMGRSLLRRDEVTMADVFSKAGYRTGIFGKWHLGDNYPFRPQHRGFGTSLIHGGGGIGQTPDLWKNDYFDDVLLQNGKPVKTEGYCTKVFFDGALEFIEKSREKGAEKPFFCYIPTNVAHGPYNVAEEYSRPYVEAGMKGGTAKFYGMITELDENVGRLIEKLKALGIERDTIVIFMTDNGTSAGHFSAGMRGRKGSEFDGGHRVPFFIRWPGKLKGGRDIARITAHIDVLPTLVDLCSITRPKQVKIDGVTLRPLLEGGEDAVRAWPARTLVVQSHRIENPQPWRKSAVMTDRWRLVNGEQLFDMRSDPEQKKNLAAEKPDLVVRLRQRYSAWYDSCDEKFDTFCEIILGSPVENPTTLTCHDWHSAKVPWHQGAVMKTPAANGFWAVEVEVAGSYEVTLRTRPTGDDSYKFQSGTARVKVGDVEVEAGLSAGSSEAKLAIQLPAGKTRLKTWIEEEGRKPRGAFFVSFLRK